MTPVCLTKSSDWRGFDSGDSRALMRIFVSKTQRN